MYVALLELCLVHKTDSRAMDMGPPQMLHVLCKSELPTAVASERRLEPRSREIPQGAYSGTCDNHGGSLEKNGMDP